MGHGIGKSRSFWFLQKHWISPANNRSQLLTGLRESGEATQLGPAGACPDRRLPRALGSPMSLSGSQTGLPCTPVAFLELTGPGVTGSVGGAGREARLAREDGSPPQPRMAPAARAPRGPGPPHSSVPQGSSVHGGAAEGQYWCQPGAEAELSSCRAPMGPAVWGPVAVEDPGACRPDHTHGCPPGLPAEEADREAQQAPPLPAAGGGTALSSCSERPAGRVSQPQPHVTPRAFAEAAHLSQLPSGPQRLQGLQEQARVLAWGDRAGLWRDCVRRGAPP